MSAISLVRKFCSENGYTFLEAGIDNENYGISLNNVGYMNVLMDLTEYLECKNVEIDFSFANLDVKERSPGVTVIEFPFMQD